MNRGIIAFFIVFYFPAVDGFAQSLSREFAHDRYLFNHYNEFNEHKKTRLKRFYAGICKPSMSFDIIQHYVPDPYYASIPALSQTIDLETTTGSGTSFGNFAGSFFPIFRFGAARAVCLDVAVCGELLFPKIGPINYGNSVTGIKDEGDVMIISLPIGLVYKSGGDVSMSKRDKILFSFGFGLAPTESDSKILAAHIDFSVRRYLMAEFGMFTGFGWKLRATYFAGNFTVVNKKGDMMNSVNEYTLHGGQGLLDVNATGSSDFNIAVLMYPFSIHWDK